MMTIRNPLNLPQINAALVNDNGNSTITWYQFFQGIFARLGGTPGLIPLASYPVGSLPPAADYTNCLVRVLGSVTNKTLAVSDGTHWLWADGTVVS